MGIMRTLKINGEVFNIIPVVPASSVTLLASAWVSGGTSHYQVVDLPGVTSHTKVDLQPTPEQLEEFHTLSLAFVTENENGVVTVYAIGDKPTGDHTIQTTLTEVEREGKIRGNTVGTTVPRTDFNQTDSAQADYLNGREKIVQSVNGITPDENGNVVVSGGSGGGSGGEVFVPKAQVTQTANGARIIITDQHGTSEATVNHGKDGEPGVYILAEGETIADAPADADVVIDPAGTPDVDLSDYAKTEDIPTDAHINNLINTALGVIENGSY